MKIDDIEEILNGNGNPKKGLVFKVASIENDMLNMKGTLYALEKTSSENKVMAIENNALLKGMANGKSQKKVLGVSAVTRDKLWLNFSRLMTIIVTAIVSYVGLIK